MVFRAWEGCACGRPPGGWGNNRRVGSDMVEGFAELDGLEVRGFFVESRFAEGVEKSLDEEKGGGLVRAGDWLIPRRSMPPRSSP